MNVEKERERFMMPGMSVCACPITGRRGWRGCRSVYYYSNNLFSFFLSPNWPVVHGHGSDASDIP